MGNSKKYSNSLIDFARVVIQERKFYFRKDELAFDVSALIRNKVLSEENGFISIQNAGIVASAAFDIFCIEFAFNIGNQIASLKAFIARVEGYFPGGYLSGRTQFNTAFFSFLISDFVNKQDGDLVALARSYKRSDGDLFSFQNAFCDALPELKIQEAVLTEAILHLTEQVKVDREDVLDMNRVGIANALKSFLIVNPMIAKILLDKWINVDDPILPEYSPAILNANFMAGRKFIDQLAMFIDDEKLQGSVICTMGGIAGQSFNTYERFIRIVERKTPYSPQALNELSRFYTNILGLVKNGPAKLTARIFKNLRNLTVQYPHLTLQFAFDFKFVEGFEKEIAEWVLSVISGSKNQQEAAGILQAFVKFKDIAPFFTALRVVIGKEKAHFDAEIFGNLFMFFIEQDPQGFRDGVINLLIDDNGLVRYSARRVLHTLSRRLHFKSLVTDIKRYPALTLYKLAIAITDDFHEPEDLVPFIAPFLDSEFLLVRELTLHRLEIMCENFLIEVVEALECNLNPENSSHQEMLARIKAYTMLLNARIDRTKGIREIDPRYTQNKYLRQYFEDSGRDISENLDRSSKNTGLARFFSKEVKIAKGGGFSKNDTQEVTPLASVKAQITLPRTYFLAPETYDLNLRSMVDEDWTNVFEPWEAVISS